MGFENRVRKALREHIPVQSHRRSLSDIKSFAEMGFELLENGSKREQSEEVICRSGICFAIIDLFVRSVSWVLRAGNIPPPYRRNGSRSAIYAKARGKSIVSSKCGGGTVCNAEQAQSAKVARDKPLCEQKEKHTTRVCSLFGCGDGI